MKQVPSTYWRSREVLQNLGDHVTEAILRALGYDFVDFDAASKDELEHFDHILFAAGTILEENWVRKIGERQIIVWGSGTSRNTPLNARMMKNLQFRAVRGPITRWILNLPQTIPLGDPALLLPRWYRFSRAGKKPSIFVPHFHNQSFCAPEKRCCRLGVDQVVDVAVEKWEWLARVEQIASAGFVLTNSLHGAIIAHAYGVPWAICLSDGEHFDKPVKWWDWFAYLGLPLDEQAKTRTLAEGVAWWDSCGKFAARPSTDPLLKAFPYPVPAH